jgi:hypothetical protein
MLTKLICLAALMGNLGGAGELADQWVARDGGRVILPAFATAPYPHASREQGWTNRAGRFFGAENYQDSTVGIFVPDGYRAGAALDVVVHFHGHGSNVRKNLDDFELCRQFAESGVNAVLVMPQGPKSVPDSGCGKLELEPGAFAAMLDEVRHFLVAQGVTNAAEVRTIVITSFSGGYKVAAAVLEIGGIESDGKGAEISDVLLLDSSYGSLERFARFAAVARGARLVSIYTPHLRDENETLRKQLLEAGVRPRELEEPVDEDMAGPGVILIATSLKHNEVPAKSGYLRRLLSSSSLERR